MYAGGRNIGATNILKYLIQSVLKRYYPNVLYKVIVVFGEDPLIWSFKYGGNSYKHNKEISLASFAMWSSVLGNCTVVLKQIVICMFYCQ